MDIREITHWETAAPPLFVARTGALRWADETWHEARYRRDPQGYALLGLMPGLAAAHRARVLLTLLRASWTELDAPTRATLSRVVRVLGLALPATDVLTVLLALRHTRANHKHVTRATVALLVDHPQAPVLLRTHRRALVACVEHALGQATARGCARGLGEGAAGREVHRALPRFATDPGLAVERLLALYGRGPSPAVDPTGLAPTPVSLVDLDGRDEWPDTVTATNRGDVAATLVHLYRGGGSAELETALEGYVATAAQRMARYPGTLVLVLDRSPSMRGHGEREWAVFAQAEALRRTLQRCCERLLVVPVGGSADPGGGTDLAGGLLEALRARPDLVAIASDGYENTYPGDLARVVAELAAQGEPTPIVFCTSTFGHSDDLTLRRPAPALPQRAFWHEADFAPLVLWLLAHTDTAEADRALGDGLRLRLAAAEDALTHGRGVPR